MRTRNETWNGHVIRRCTAGQGDGSCSGCRNPALDCMYEALCVCATCGCYEGSLLPFCPGREVGLDEQAKIYKHYCAGTGPFARATLENISAAYEACYKYLYEDVGSMPPHREGAHRLFYAVCALQTEEG